MPENAEIKSHAYTGADGISPVQALLAPELAPLFWPPKRQGVQSAWWKHVPFAMWLTTVAKPSVIVELGTHNGVSYAAFCEAVQRSGLATRCYAVDSWEGDAHTGAYDQSVYADLAQFHDQAYSGFSEMIRANFDDAMPYFEDGTVDILHIDGYHTYEAVKHDFDTWLPKLSKKAVVLFHDTNVKRDNFGVWKFWAQVSKAHPSFEFLHGHGLGVLAHGPNAPKAILEMCALDDQVSVATFCTRFATLGERWFDNWQRRDEILGLARRLDEKDREIARLTIHSGEQESRFQTMQAELEGKALSLVAEKEHVLQSAVLAARAEMDAVLQQANVKLNALSDRYASENRTQRKSFFSRILSPWSKKARKKGRQVAIIENSVFFDAKWYVKKNHRWGLPLHRAPNHYFQRGTLEGLDPGPHFSTKDYLQRYPDVAQTGLNALVHYEKYGRQEGRVVLAKKLPQTAVQPAPVAVVIDPPEILTAKDRRLMSDHIRRLKLVPLISVAMPVYNPPIRFLKEAIDSVISQSYPNWELCIANDASPDPEVAGVLNAYAAKDKRIKIVHRAENGHISAATNSAFELAQGEFVALMDHDDLLHETALYEVAVEINAHPDADLIYSDEDKIDENGVRSTAYFKSDFNPELFLGQNMISHLGVYRRSILEKIGGMRVGFEGSQDYDLALRTWMASSTDKIRHIPAVLYHWRRGTNAPSFSESQLQRCIDAARQSIQEFLDNEGEAAKVEAAPDVPSFSRIRRKIPLPLPLVSVIILTKDKADLLAVCVDGILNKTDYSNLEILIVDHDSQEASTKELFDELRKDSRVRIISYKGIFNYSKMNNMAVKLSNGDILALLNNDIEVLNPDWLYELVSHSVRREIGVVGAKLYFPDGRIQHAGVVVGLGGVAGHSLYFADKATTGYVGNSVLTRAASAVTAACFVVRKSVFLEVDGFNEKHLTVAYNDVDFCLKVQAHGYRNVWTPFAELVHHESASRGFDMSPSKKARFKTEIDFMRKTWKDLIDNDPFYNPNLSLNSSLYEAIKPSRRPKPWTQKWSKL